MFKTPNRALNEKLRKVRVLANIRSIRNRDFCIIASNCTGTLPYRFLNIPYNTPTVNLFFFAPCYLKFVKNLDYYLREPLVFYPTSRYKEGEMIRNNFEHHYPIGTLDDIEVHFMHYKTAAEAKNKWDKRKKRISTENLIFAFTDKDLCTPQLLEEFDSLPFPNKYVLTANHFPKLKSAIQVPYFEGETEIGDCYTHYGHLAHVDFKQLVAGKSTTTRAQKSPRSERKHIEPESI